MTPLQKCLALLYLLDIVVRFEQDVYSVDEAEGEFEVCVVLERSNVADGNITLEVQVIENGTAIGKSSYSREVCCSDCDLGTHDL